MVYQCRVCGLGFGVQGVVRGVATGDHSVEAVGWVAGTVACFHMVFTIVRGWQPADGCILVYSVKPQQQRLPRRPRPQQQRYSARV